MSLHEHKPEDHWMNREELQLMPIEFIEAQLRQEIEKMRDAGVTDTHELEEKLNDTTIKRKTLEYLFAITNPEERAEAVNDMMVNGLPPEVLAPEGTFIVEGSPLRQ